MFMSDSKFAEYQKQTIARMAYDLRPFICIRECSDNHSPTLNSMIVGIDESKGTCTLQILPSHYPNMDNSRVGETYEQSIQIVHNGYFY